MHLRIALACLALLTVPAHADGMAFFVKNQHARAVAVELYGRQTVWPGNDQVFLLDAREKKSIPITCELGERICWAAWVNGDAGTYWGVGPDMILRKACSDGARQPSRHTAYMIPQRWRRLHQVLRKQLRTGVGDERSASGEHRPADHAECVDVGAMVGGVATDGLGRQKAGGPENRAGIGDVTLGGDAEVGKEGAPAAPLEEDVLRGQVTMRDTVGVGIAECPGGLAEHAFRLVVRHGAASAHPRAQRLAIDHAHHDEDVLAFGVDRVDRDDVGMGQSCGNAGLAHEPIARRAVARQPRRQHLDRDRAVEPHVAREIDRGHPAASQFALERVAADE